jgi:hypothetical protein
MDLEGQSIAVDLCFKLTEGILTVLSDASPLEVVDMRRDALVEDFTGVKLIDQFDVLKLWQKEEITCLKYRDYVDFTIKPVSVDFERLKILEIRPYSSGLVQHFPAALDQWASGEYHNPHVLHDMCSESAVWEKLLNCSTVAELSEIISKREIDDLKWIAEGLH